MDECVICCSPNKKPITCRICNFCACYNCFSKFMIDCTSTPKCMKCDKPWTRKHLVDSFGQYFVSNRYKKKREEVLFELEKAMMPDTQPLAAKAKRVEEINKTIRARETMIDTIRGLIYELAHDGAVDEETFQKYLRTRKELIMSIHDHQEEITNLVLTKRRIVNTSVKNEKKPNSFVIKCPSEECRGYVNMTKNAECELCHLKLCKECHEALDKSTDLDKAGALDKGAPLDRAEALGHHTCNPDTVNSVKMIYKDSKNCPSCKSVIYKIDGCDQMFCTQCHTAFSWRTGDISMGRIHNPHYYEYLRQTGAERELGDIPCGGLPRITRQIAEDRFLSKVHRAASHFEFYEIPRLQNDLNYVNGNVNLRIMYLNGHIDDSGFKREIYRREKALEKKREILTVLNTFVIVVADLFRTGVKEGVQFESIRKFTCENLEDVSRVYKCTVPYIRNSDWDTSITYRYGRV